jgi:uncharacterized membrane protein
MSRNRPNLWLCVAVIGGVVYPLLIYFFHNIIPSLVWVLLGLALIGLRLLGLRDVKDMRLWRLAFIGAAALLVFLMCLAPQLAVFAYPIVISLSVASIFGLSLVFPPTIVERIARRQEPGLDAKGVRYTRRVTQIWFMFLLVNASLSASLALWGTVAQWSLWNGLLSYLCMGLLFAGEIIIRRKVRA